MHAKAGKLAIKVRISGKLTAAEMIRLRRHHYRQVGHARVKFCKRELARILDSQGTHAAIEMTAIDSHQLRGARNVSFSFLELALNKLAMISLGSLFE